jgi:outer membrane protein assembly factor BamB
MADGTGLLYLGVREAGDDEIWVFPERWSGETPEPKAKLEPELPGDLNNLFAGRQAGTLYALCGDNWVVALKDDGTVIQRVELPGDSRPEDGGVDSEGNIYVRRSSGPAVKVKPDGTVDQGWAKSEAAVIDYVRSVAVDSRGMVYVAASEGGIYLRAYDASGALAFNIVTEKLSYSPDRLVVASRDYLYALDGQDLYEFRP